MSGPFAPPPPPGAPPPPPPSPYPPPPSRAKRIVSRVSTAISLVTAAGAVKELGQDVIAEGKFTGTDARDALEIALAFKPTGTPTVLGNEDEILNRLFGLGVASGAAASGGGSGGGEFPIPDGRANLN